MGVLFWLWVTVAWGYQVAYRDLLGFILYAFLSAHRGRLGEASEPVANLAETAAEPPAAA